MAIVTGPATGLGAAMAKLLARKDSNLVTNYSRSQKGKEITAKEVDALGGEVLLCQGGRF